MHANLQAEHVPTCRCNVFLHVITDGRAYLQAKWGDQSPYGAELVPLLRSVADKGSFDAEDYSKVNGIGVCMADATDVLQVKYLAIQIPLRFTQLHTLCHAWSNCKSTSVHAHLALSCMYTLLKLWGA